MTSNNLIKKVMQTPSIQAAIKRGDYTAAEAEAEFLDQIEMKDTATGLLLVDDLSEDVRQAITYS
jgi:hypothetical protein